MSDRKKVIVSSIGILLLVCFVVAAFTLEILYQAAFDQERNRLMDVVRSQARIMESMAKYGRKHFFADSKELQAAAVAQVRDAYSRHVTFGRTGEVVLARREGDSILYLLRHFGTTTDKPEPISFGNLAAEPMRRALSGQSGWVIGPDYRGVTVLAAYEPISELGLGIVAKTDLSEVREPFVRAAGYAAAVMLLMVLGGSFLYLILATPMIRRIEESEARYRSLVELSPDFVGVLTDGSFIFVNPAGAKLLGPPSPEALLGKDLIDIIPAEHHERVRELIRRVLLDKRQTPVMEVTVKRVDGEWREVEVTGTFIRYLEKPSVLVAMRDVSERKAVEEELKRARDEALSEKNNLEAFMEALPVGVAILDVRGGNIRSNSVFEQIWGGPRPVPRSVSDYAAYKAWWPDTGKPLRPEEWASARAVESGETVSGQLIRIERFDGTQAFVLNSGTPIWGKDKQIIGSAVAILDITELFEVRTSELISANQVLDRQREVLETIVDNIPVMLCFYDPAGKVLLASREMERLLGWSLGDMQRSGFDIMVECYPDPQYRKIIWEFMMEAGPGWRDFTMKIRSGDTLESSWANVRLSDGSQIGIGLDVTERKRAERALKESEERFRLIAETIQDVFWMSTPGIGKMLYVSPAYERIWGRTRESLYAEPLSFVQAVHPHDRELLLEEVRDHAKGSYECEYRILQPNGSVRWIEDRGFPIHSPEGELVCMVGVASDVTDKKRVQKALEKNESLLRAVLETLPVGVWIIGSDGTIQFANPAGEQIWGGVKYVGMEQYGEYKAWRVDTGELIKPHDWSAARAVTRGEVSMDEVIEIEAFDGLHKTILASAVPVRDIEERIIAAVVLNQDITDRVRDEEKLEATMKKLEESNRTLQDFASIASHDMQEPLRKVIAFGNMLDEKYGNSLGAEGRNYLDRMLNATRRMQNLLGSLLDYSRVSSRAEPFTEVDLSLLVSEVLSDLEVRIEKTGATIILDELPMLEADPTQMRQLFQNLVGNALKFHKEGEKPVVRVHCFPEGAGAYTFTIEDNGIGFDEEYLDKIFAPFQRLHGRSSPYEGTGMGLAICRKIVERHGGSITARSVPGKGAGFIVTLPIKQKALDESKERVLH
jgi:PAS domain S-box-containing protein